MKLVIKILTWEILWRKNCIEETQKDIIPNHLRFFETPQQRKTVNKLYEKDIVELKQAIKILRED